MTQRIIPGPRGNSLWHGPRTARRAMRSLFLFACAAVLSVNPALAAGADCDASSSTQPQFRDVECAGVRSEIDGYRMWSRLIASTGLLPDELVVVHGDAPLSTWTVNRDGRNRIAMKIGTDDGEVPADLALFLADHGIPLAGAIPSEAKPFETPRRMSNAEAFDLAHGIADRVLREAGIDPLARGNEMMRYSMARYLRNGTSDEGLVWLATSFNGSNTELIASPLIGKRWSSKIDRNLKAPFTNAETMASLRTLAGQVKQVIGSIRARNTAGAPLEFFVAGSPLKARLGGASDIDLQVRTPDAALLDFALNGDFGFPSGNGTLVDTGDWKEFTSRGQYFGPIASIGDGVAVVRDPETIVRFYIEQSKAWGVRISPDGAWSLDATAKDLFDREAPRITEDVFGAARTLKGKLELSSLASYLEDLPSLDDAALMPAPRIIELGKKLADARSRCGLQPRDPLERMLLDFGAAAK